MILFYLVHSHREQSCLLHPHFRGFFQSGTKKIETLSTPFSALDLLYDVTVLSINFMPFLLQIELLTLAST